MTPTPRHLPDFENPPVGEVVLSVQFAKLPRLEAAHLGLLWQEFRTDFPKTETHPPSDPTPEKFEPPSRRSPTIRLELRQQPAVPRVWFVSESGAELIQIQQDRFTCNWRRTVSEDAYPRYPHVRSEFIRNFEVFQRFLSKNHLVDGELVPEQCEVAYLNQILQESVWGTHGEADKVTRLWNGSAGQGVLPSPESIEFAARYPITTNDKAGKSRQIGRLHVTLEPAIRMPNGEPMFLFNLLARGEPIAPNMDEVLHFFDIGHELIVTGFEALTTTEMHHVWRLR